jgi:Asp-tRNA(Asn)/Glu-tRNA(Gln) amidotransferase A subunit family amidase
MTTDEICFLPALSLRDAYARGELSPVDAVDAVLDRIERRNAELNTFVTLLPAEARQAARRAEQQLRAGQDVGPLHGIPVLIKDLTPTAGIRTTFGSVAYADHVPQKSAIAWERIRDAGAILIGKTTTPDFGELGVTESSLTGTTGNPWDASRTSGGSSGGSAAAVVAGFGHLAWGSDGGGSIRIPASFCGAVGLKASIGRIPGFGEQTPFEAVTTCGPLTRTVGDAALLLGVTAGPDLRDPIALPATDTDWVAVTRDPDISAMRIAYSPDLGQSLIATDVRDAVESALEVLRRLGASVEKISLDLPEALEYFVSWWGPEYVSVVDDEVAGREIPKPVKEIADLARGITVEDMYRTQTVTRPLIAAEFARVFADFDAIVSPTMPVTAFPNAGPAAGPTEINGVPIERPYLYFTRTTEPFSHIGLPAISVLCGFSPNGLPVGLHIAGPYHDDAIVLRVAAAYEQATPWVGNHPQ